MKRCFLLLMSGMLMAFFAACASIPDVAPKQPEASSGTALVQQDNSLLDALEKSISVTDGNFSFTLPESEGTDWNIQMYGRTEQDGMGMSAHYLEDQNEKGLWESGQTYSVQLADSGYTSLELFISIPSTGEEITIDLMPFLQ